MKRFMSFLFGLSVGISLIGSTYLMAFKYELRCGPVFGVPMCCTVDTDTNEVADCKIVF